MAVASAALFRMAYGMVCHMKRHGRRVKTQQPADGTFPCVHASERLPFVYNSADRQPPVSYP